MLLEIKKKIEKRQLQKKSQILRSSQGNILEAKQIEAEGEKRRDNLRINPGGPI